ncbi:MAG: magnesium transporter [Hyphomonadaceae bacterium]|nr:magnesium transporter [Hyphomonadaceae bacterium]
MAEDIERAGAETAAEPNRFEIDPHFVTLVTGAAYDRDGPALRRLTKGLHPADLADLVEHLPEEALNRLFRLIGPELPSAFLAELEWETREQVLALLPADYVGRALGELDTDDAAAVAADLDEGKLEEALAAADKDTRLAVEQGLAADEDTAGRLMQRELVAAPEYWTVGDAIDHMRSADADLPDVFFEIYVVDPGFRPIGSAPLSTLIRAPRETKMRDIMRPPQALIHPAMDQEEVAFVFRKYNLASAPVVDEAGRLTGVLTVDDIVHVIHEEGEEDLLKLSGVSDASQTDTIATSVRARAPWLSVNLLTGLASATVISFFGASIEKVVALAVLMPLVASVGGNAGTQALAVAVRAIAARDLTTANAFRHILRELLTGLCNGLFMAGLLAAAAHLWFNDLRITTAVGLAVVINLTMAGLAGILAPLTLRRFGADPAVSSSVFVTFVTDFTGFFAFLGLATVFLA